MIETISTEAVYLFSEGRNESIPQYIEVPLNIEAKESIHTFLPSSPTNLIDCY
jgi:hypothetical protein